MAAEDKMERGQSKRIWVGYKMLYTGKTRRNGVR